MTRSYFLQRVDRRKFSPSSSGKDISGKASLLYALQRLYFPPEGKKRVVRFYILQRVESRKPSLFTDKDACRVLLSYLQRVGVVYV